MSGMEQPDVDENRKSSSEQSKSDDTEQIEQQNEPEIVGEKSDTSADQGLIGPSARPMTADPFDSTASGVSNIEASMGIDYWLCPYCPDFTTTDKSEIRTHITTNGDDFHAGQNGYSHDRHIPAFDTDDELVAALLGVTDSSNPTGILAVEELPDSITITTHPDNNDKIPMSLHEDSSDADSEDSQTTDDPTSPTTEETTSSTMSETEPPDESTTDPSVVAWICPYCSEANDNSRGMRLHIHNSPGDGHEDKSGWALEDQVPGIDVDGEVVAVLPETTENSVIPVDELDDPPEVALGSIPNIDEYLGELSIDTVSENESDTSQHEPSDGDGRDDTESTTEPLGGDKKIKIVNAWVSAGELESELDLDEDEEFSPEDVSEVVEASYSYTFKTGKQLENDKFDNADLDDALDEKFQSEYRERLMKRLRQKRETVADDENGQVEDESDQIDVEIDSETSQDQPDAQQPVEEQRSLTESGSKSETETPDPESPVSGAPDETDTAVDQTAESPASKSITQSTAESSAESSTMASESQSGPPYGPGDDSETIDVEDLLEEGTALVSVDDIRKVQEIMAELKSEAEDEKKAFGDDIATNARASERAYMAERVTELIDAVVLTANTKPDSPLEITN